MTVRYEWDVEETITYDEDTNDILDHHFQDSYTGVKRFIEKHPDYDNVSYDAVLICDDDNGRSWAYIEDGKLPEYFQDAYQNNTRKVPARFHKEIANS